MDFRRPLQVITPTLDGDVLAVLGRADADVSGRQIHRLVGHSSEEGVRRAAERLTRQGIVLRKDAGRAHLYRLNREHVAAPWVEGLASLRTQLIDRLRTEVEGWLPLPRVALIFGSFVRGEATPESDLDLLVVRPAGCDAELEDWREQVARIERLGTAWTGNDTRVLELGEDELLGSETEPVLQAAANDGVEILGTRRNLKRLMKGKA